MATEHTCSKCKRKLIDRYFDKCMYCGHPIDAHQQLSAKEKEALKQKKEIELEAQQAQHKKYMARQSEKMKKDTEGFCGAGGLGSDFGAGDSGGGDC